MSKKLESHHADSACEVGVHLLSVDRSHSHDFEAYGPHLAEALSPFVHHLRSNGHKGHHSRTPSLFSLGTADSFTSFLLESA